MRDEKHTPMSPVIGLPSKKQSKPEPLKPVDPKQYGQQVIFEVGQLPPNQQKLFKIGIELFYACMIGVFFISIFSLALIGYFALSGEQIVITPYNYCPLPCNASASFPSYEIASYCDDYYDEYNNSKHRVIEVDALD